MMFFHHHSEQQANIYELNLLIGSAENKILMIQPVCEETWLHPLGINISDFRYEQMLLPALKEKLTEHWYFGRSTISKISILVNWWNIYCSSLKFEHSIEFMDIEVICYLFISILLLLVQDLGVIHPLCNATFAAFETPLTPCLLYHIE